MEGISKDAGWEQWRMVSGKDAEQCHEGSPSLLLSWAVAQQPGLAWRGQAGCCPSFPGLKNLLQGAVTSSNSWHGKLRGLLKVKPILQSSPSTAGIVGSGEQSCLAVPGAQLAMFCAQILAGSTRGRPVTRDGCSLVRCHYSSSPWLRLQLPSPAG